MAEKTRMEKQMGWPAGEEDRRMGVVKSLKTMGHSEIELAQRECRRRRRTWTHQERWS